MNILFECSKSPTSIFCTSGDGFHNFWLPFCGEIYKQSSMKSLTNSGNPSSSPLKKACSGFQLATCWSKVVPKAGHDIYITVQ
jgi:hypothetical protein